MLPAQFGCGQGEYGAVDAPRLQTDETANNNQPSGSFKPSEKRDITDAAYAAAACLMLFFLLGYILPPVIGFIIGRGLFFLKIDTRSDATVLISSSIGAVASTLLPFRIASALGIFNYPKSRQKVKPNIKAVLAAVLVLPGVMAVGIQASSLVQSGFEGLGIVFKANTYAPPSALGALLLYWANMIIIPAVCEELVFRKYLLSMLRPMGDGFALITSSALFALVHILPVRWPHAFLTGLAMGCFTILSGTLWSAILMHALNNLLIVVAMSAPDPAWLFQPDFALFILVSAAVSLWILKTDGRLLKSRPPCRRGATAVRLRRFWLSAPMIVFVLAVVLMAADGVMR
jgi:membrane protease YdiL (CAAX protease family)